MALKEGEQESLYRTLLESTQAIPWKINWETRAFEYIGPQIEKLLGWGRDSWARAQDWIDRVHPEDREAPANLCIAQSEHGIDHEADYRALTADGGYVWVRDVVRVLREGGETTALEGIPSHSADLRTCYGGEEFVMLLPATDREAVHWRGPSAVARWWNNWRFRTRPPKRRMWSPSVLE